MRIAFSPCPNDTFIFHAWVHQLIPHAPKLDVIYRDIDITNQLAMNGNGPDIMKVSCAALPWVLSNYTLLPCGGALGKGCGPLILVNKKILKPKPEHLVGKKIAIPSKLSTAYLLFQLWAKKNIPGEIDICTLPFHQIMPAIRDGKMDAGLVIHEARFTFPSYNLAQLIDLGKWWEETTNLPIPLGAIIAHKSRDPKQITKWIQLSLEYGWKNPTSSKSYIAHHAQEMDPLVIQNHISLYVNQFSMELGRTGYEAISTLLHRGFQKGILPEVNLQNI